MILKMQFGHTIVRFLADSYIPWDERLSSFAAPENAPRADLTYTVALTDAFPAHKGKLIRRSAFYQVYDRDGAEDRYYTFPDGMIYAACRQDGADVWSILYLRDFAAFLQGNTTLFYLSAIEYRMIEKGDMILHASYVLDEEKALLFAAPSGTGKSTQAGLWQKCRGSRLINGDRVLLHREKGEWLACGWPMAGSSGRALNETHPIRALVLLDKGPANEIRRLQGEEAVHLVGGEIVLRSWSQRDVAAATGYLTELTSALPVYTYACRKDDSAVSDLFDRLKADGLYDRSDFSDCV